MRLVAAKPCLQPIHPHPSLHLPSRRYLRVLTEVPETFVGPLSELKRVVRVICREMAASFEATGMELPPCMEAEAMLSRWTPSEEQDAPVSPPKEHQPAATDAAQEPSPLPSTALALTASFPEPCQASPTVVEGEQAVPAATKEEEPAPTAETSDEAAEREEGASTPSVMPADSHSQLRFVDLSQVSRPEAFSAGCVKSQTSSAGGARPQSFLQAVMSSTAEPNPTAAGNLHTRTCISDPGSCANNAGALLLCDEDWPALLATIPRPAPKPAAAKSGAWKSSSARAAASALDTAKRGL